MSGSAVIDVVIGLSLLYLASSLLCSVIQEWIAQIFGWRARHLESAIHYLLDDSKKGLNSNNAANEAKNVLDHPLVKMLTTSSPTILASWSKKPVYIPAKNFTLALLDCLDTTKFEDDPNDKSKKIVSSLSLNSLASIISKSKSESLVKALSPILTTSGTDVNKAIAGIEAWYDSAMDRASGWYKRQVRWCLLVMGLALAGFVNADTLQVAMHLAADSALRDKVATLAAATAPSNGNPAESVKNLSETTAKQLSEGDLLKGFGDLPIGWEVCGGWGKVWNNGPASCYPGEAGETFGWASKLIGFLLTGLAVSLGAPFWFGLLQQLNAARSAGPKPSSQSSTSPT